MHFCPKGPAFCKISQQIILKLGNSKPEKFSNYLISEESYGSFEHYRCLINSLKFIHCSLPKQPNYPFVSPVIHSSKINMEMVMLSRLAKIRPFL